MFAKVRSLRVAVIGACIVAGFAFVPAVLAAGGAVAPGFAIYDSIQYRGKPDLSSYGFHKIVLISDGVLAPPVRSGGPRRFNAAATQAAALKQASEPGVPVCLDLEAWPLSSDGVNERIKIIEAFKQHSPGTPVGAFGFMPINNRLLFDSMADPSTRKLYDQAGPYGKSSRDMFDGMQPSSQAIGQAVDILMPDFYTYGPDMSAWKKMVQANVAYDRKMYPGKPIYAFIWPQYNASIAVVAQKKPLPLSFVPAAAWREELETLYPLVDGIVIWSAWDDHDAKVVQFNKDMPWFVQTVAFMKEHHLH